jgi:hypothetical protein
VGQAAAELARAEAELRLGQRLAKRLRAGPSDAAAAQLAASRKRFEAHWRHAQDLLAGPAGQGVGPGGKSLADWLKDLRHEQDRLARVPGAEQSPGTQAKTSSEEVRAFFRLPERGLPSYWYSAAPGQPPRVELTALADDHWRESASATELLLIVLLGVWVLAYLPRVQRWLGRLLPEQVVLLGWLGTQAFGWSPVGVLLLLGGVGARLAIVSVWVQNRLRRGRAGEPPPGSSLHPA